jgi:hypothetical protein
VSLVLGLVILAAGIAVVGWTVWAAVIGVRKPAFRTPLIAAGLIVAVISVGEHLISEYVVGKDVSILAVLGLPGLYMITFLALVALEMGAPFPGDAVFLTIAMLVFWLTNTAVLGLILAGWRWQRARRAAPALALCGALTLGASACLSATPPKTPNQREAERHAPRAIVPPPPDAGRTPHPAD